MKYRCLDNILRWIFSTARFLYFWILLINRMDTGATYTHLAFGRGGTALNWQILWSENRICINIDLFYSSVLHHINQQQKEDIAFHFWAMDSTAVSRLGVKMAGITPECHYNKILTHSHCLLIPPSSPCHAYKLEIGGISEKRITLIFPEKIDKNF